MKLKHITTIFFLSTGLAYGETIDILGQKLNFKNPYGYCTLGGSQRERDLSNISMPPNAPFRIIHFAALCNELEDYKNGVTEGIDHWLQIQLLGPNGIFKKVDTNKESFLTGVAKKSPIVNTTELMQRINSALTGLDRSVSNIQIIPLGRDNNAVYFSQQSVARIGSSSRTVTSILGVTLANSLPISVVVNEGIGTEESKKQLQATLLQTLISITTKN